MGRIERMLRDTAPYTKCVHLPKNDHKIYMHPFSAPRFYNFIHFPKTDQLPHLGHHYPTWDHLKKLSLSITKDRSGMKLKLVPTQRAYMHEYLKPYIVIYGNPL